MTSEVEIVQRGAFALTLRRLWADKASMAAAGFILFLVLFAAAAPLVEAWTGHAPIAQFRETGLSAMGLPVAPNGEFIFGTDHLGRDALVPMAPAFRCWWASLPPWQRPSSASRSG